MSAVEKRIADCILADPEEAMNSTVVYIASRAEVSEGSVINFSNMLGYKGFSQLKINLAQNISTYNAQDEILKDDTPKQIMRKMIDQALTSFESTYDTIGTELSRAVELLLKASRIIVVGVGSSKPIATDISIRMMRIGLLASAETDPLLASLVSAQLKENDVVFAVSHSGRTKEVLRIAEAAHSVGAKLICLTGHPNSPLASTSDVALIAVSMESKNHREATTARLTQLMISDCLIDSVANRIGDDAIVLLDKEVEVFEQHREAINTR